MTRIVMATTLLTLAVSLCGCEGDGDNGGGSGEYSTSSLNGTWNVIMNAGGTEQQGTVTFDSQGNIVGGSEAMSGSFVVTSDGGVSGNLRLIVVNSYGASEIHDTYQSGAFVSQNRIETSGTWSYDSASAGSGNVTATIVFQR